MPIALCRHRLQTNRPWLISPNEITPWASQLAFPLHQEYFILLFSFDHICQIPILSDTLLHLGLTTTAKTISVYLERSPQNTSQSNNYTHGTNYHYMLQPILLASFISSPMYVFIHLFIQHWASISCGPWASHLTSLPQLLSVNGLIVAILEVTVRIKWVIICAMLGTVLATY